MKPKHYTAHQAAELTGREYHALRKQLERDSKKEPEKRKYRHAKKCECGIGWLIPGKDLKINEK